MAREYCALRCLPKGLARISSFGKLSHQFSAIEQFEQIGESVVSRGAFAGKMAGEDGLRLKDRLDQYGVVVHLALVPYERGPALFHSRRQLVASENPIHDSRSGANQNMIAA
jgi:hypothetical protein